MSGADGLPRWQVPVPSQASPPRLGPCAGLPEGGDGEGRGPGRAWAGTCVQLPSSRVSLLQTWGRGRGLAAPSLLSWHPHPPRCFLCVR